MTNITEYYNNHLIFERYNSRGQIFSRSNEYSPITVKEAQDEEDKIFASKGCETEVEKYLFELKRIKEKLIEREKCAKNHSTIHELRNAISYLQGIIMYVTTASDDFSKQLEKESPILNGVSKAVEALVSLEIEFGINTYYKSVFKRIYDSCINYAVTCGTDESSHLRGTIDTFNQKRNFVRSFIQNYGK